MTQDSDEDGDDDDDDDEEAEGAESDGNEDEDGEDESVSDSQDSDEDDVEESEDKVLGNISKWKEPLKEKGGKKNPNLMHIVYGASASSATALINENNEISDDEDFFKPKGEHSKVYQFMTIQSLVIISYS